MIRRTIILWILISGFVVAFAQQHPITVEVANKPLNQVLLQLRDQYNLQLSFNDNELSKYTVTVNRKFQNAEETIQFLLQNLPFEVKNSGNVFIIIPVKKKKEEKQKVVLHSISGQVVEAGSLEPLPFSHILINNHRHLVSDMNGAFNYTASADSSFHVRVSHLGYFIYDTLLFAGASPRLMLIPSMENLSEILVENNVVETAALIGDQPGNMKLNHTIARYLPGQGDNSVFNLLRLMPGVQAAGEQATDLIIWGSYEGHSQITFDGFTVFGLKNYNDNISVVNPFMVKNIEIFKGGYDARYGNRVGGIVNITGKNGSLQKPAFSFNVNNTTVNVLGEMPLSKKTSMVMAARRTFFNLYNPDDFNIFAPTRPALGNINSVAASRNMLSDLDVYPDDYRFSDLNLKITSQFDNGNLFYISLYGGGDHFGLSADADFIWRPRVRQAINNEIPYNLNLSIIEKNRQRGASIYYGIKWGSSFHSSFIISHSDFLKTSSEHIALISQKNEITVADKQSIIENRVVENSVAVHHSLFLKNAYQIDFGSDIAINPSSLKHSLATDNIQVIDTTSLYGNNNISLYFNGFLPVTDRLSVKSGTRVIFSNTNRRMFIEPRISSSFRVSEKLKAHASWGVYHQFVYKLASVDADRNYTWHWVSAGGKIPVLGSTHWVSGLNYHQNSLSINVDLYYKPIRNLTRRVFEQRLARGGYYSYSGNARTYGVDFYVKKDFGHHSAWASYTLSKTEERLAPVGRTNSIYTPALHDQRHEFKVAALYKLRSFYFTGNYVYGSGMQIIRELFNEETDNISYSRFDAAITYQLKGKLNGETGLSVLNLFDTYNLKYANLKNINIAQNVGSVKIFTGAVPFTPVLFLKMTF